MGNCIAALFAAAGEWTTVGTEQQRAFGVMTLNAVHDATHAWSHATYKLGKGESYSEVPTSFQGSWMSKQKIASLVSAERAALTKSVDADVASARNDWILAHSAQDSCEANADSAAAHSASSKANRAQAVLNMMQGSSVDVYCGLMRGLVDGNISAGQVATIKKLDPSYVNHEVTGQATIEQLTDHVKKLLKEKASGPVVQAAQALLGQAQTWKAEQTACANIGVKQAQGYLATETSEVLASLSAVHGLLAMLTLSQRELAR